MQSRLGSLIESLVNVAIGYFIATTAQMWIFYMLGEPISWQTSSIVGAFMTAVSIIRSYCLRRVFNHITIKRLKENAARN